MSHVVNTKAGVLRYIRQKCKSTLVDFEEDMASVDFVRFTNKNNMSNNILVSERYLTLRGPRAYESDVSVKIPMITHFNIGDDGFVAIRLNNGSSFSFKFVDVVKKE